MATCDSTGTWYSWNTSTSATTANTVKVIWTAWNATGSATTTSSTGDCWYVWNDTGSNTATVNTNTTLTWSNWNAVNRAVRTATPEQAAEQIRRIEESRRRQDEINRERTAAAQRAERLLLELLDEKQTKEYRANKKFRVIGADGETYEIDAEHAHGNIKKLNDKGKAIESYCVPLSDYECPTPDHIVAQLLALKANIDHLLEKANRMEILADGTRRVLPRRQRA
jgi:hypothetical protein